jgi:hypothetical protein
MNKIEELQELEAIITPEPVEEVTTLQAPKKKRIPTEKQLEVLRKARESNQMRLKEQQVKKKLEEQEIEKEVGRRLEEYRKSLEDRVLKKAISIKKKEIKRQAVLEDISDDETPIEKIKEISRKRIIQQLPSAPQQPKYIFV